MRLLLCLIGFAALFLSERIRACCAVGSRGTVINADQTVILLWDKEKSRQHFIRRASFASDAEKIGFLVPSPTRPELEEAGDGAFDLLESITAPIRRGGGGCALGCSASLSHAAGSAQVDVLETKRVAGFDAAVLRAGSGEALVGWLKENGYEHSPEIAAWAQPYLDEGWPMTALKVVENPAETEVHAKALRISFDTDRLLFPYREPASAKAAKDLGRKSRLLRFYILANQAYDGGFDKREHKWTGKRRWSGDITPMRPRLLTALALPESTMEEETWWLTEYEDPWPYDTAPGDLFFTESADKAPVRRAAVPWTGILLLLGAVVFHVGYARLRRGH